MQPTEPTETNQYGSYQYELAISLVKCLGFEGAIDACQRNNWAGVLDVLLAADRSRLC